MNNGERTTLVEMAEQRVVELTQLVEGESSVASKKRSQADDAAANLDLTINAEVDAGLASHYRFEINKLNQNIEWLNGKDAGYCDDCGNPIPVPRLKAVLSTRLCVTCEEQAQN